MSVLIKGMSKKEVEDIIRYARYEANNCMIGERAKVIELPSHGDLIDADELVELCDIMARKGDGVGASIWHQFKTIVEWRPIVIPEEDGEL